MSRNASTALGFCAVLLWALLALFTAASGSVPPFQLVAMCFLIGGVAGALAWLRDPGRLRNLRQNWTIWALGVGGLFGYHFLYFSALRAAPAAEASLIAYLWPLLIVLFSTLGSDEVLRRHHVIGALLGFIGAGFIIIGTGEFSADARSLPGYAMAFAAALVWSSYSVLSRRVAHVPTDIVAGFCLVSAVLATAAHLALEDTVWPATPLQWAAVAGLGLGPVGLAFYLWDVGVKHGDIQTLGAASYCAPLLSTFALIAAGQSPLTLQIGLACLLITAGAVIAAKDMVFSKSQTP